MWQQFSGIGNLATDVESRFTQGGTQVANFTVCCDYGYGEHKKTEFVRCVAWGKLAEICATYLRKGSKAFIQGTMETRKWEDQNGNTRYSTEIRLDVMRMLSPRGGESSCGSFEEPPEVDSEVPF